MGEMAGLSHRVAMGCLVIGATTFDRAVRRDCRASDPWRASPSICTNLVFGSDRVDIIVHSAFHPVLGPDRDSGFPPLSYYRQALASDLGAMAKRVGAKHLMLTHLGPS